MESLAFVIRQMDMVRWIFISCAFVFILTIVVMVISSFSRR